MGFGAYGKVTGFAEFFEGPDAERALERNLQ